MVTCRVLNLCRQQSYRWRAEPITDRELTQAYVANAIFDAHRDDPEFGHRFLAVEIRDGGLEACDRTVWVRCAENGWWSRFGKKGTGKGSKPGTPAHDDLVRRVFTADRPNQPWLTDITVHRIDEGKLYLCAIKDLWSNRIVGYSTEARMEARLAGSALDNGTRWTDPEDMGNGIRIDQGDPLSPHPSQQVDHVVIRHRGVVLGRDGSPIPGTIREYYDLAHIPLVEWLTWSEWYKP